MPKLKALCQTVQAGVAQTFLCSVVDHHSSSYGDKGWGCGYRNLQMLMSSLAHYRYVNANYVHTYVMMLLLPALAATLIDFFILPF